MSYEPSYSAKWSFENGADPTFSGTSPRWDFNDDSLVASDSILRTGATRGTRSGHTVATRKGPIGVAGSLSCNPSPKFLGAFLPRAMGGGTETAPALADEPTEFAALVDRGSGGVGDCYKYLGLKINRFRLIGRAGGLVECSMDLIGKSETPAATFAGAALGTANLPYSPYAVSDVVLVLDGSSLNLTLQMSDFELSIDNGLTARYVTGSRNAGAVIPNNERIVMLTGNAVLSEAGVVDDLYGYLTAEGTLPAALTFTNGTVSTAFSFTAMEFQLNSLRRSGNEFILPIRAEVLGSGSTAAEFTVTNDVTA